MGEIYTSLGLMSGTSMMCVRCFICISPLAPIGALDELSEVLAPPGLRGDQPAS